MSLYRYSQLFFYEERPEHTHYERSDVGIGTFDLFRQFWPSIYQYDYVL